MAETNIDKVAEKIERREIKRNFSNQIISYGLPEDGKLKYGYKKLPAVTTRYDRESYNNTIDGLSDELLSTRGDLGITEQSLNYIKYSDSIVEDEFVDTFSGRYAITKDAKTPIGRDSWSGYKTHHILNIYRKPAAPNNTDDKARNFRFGGLETVPFDDAEKGPSLKNGGYVITPELIESGKSIKLTVIMGIGNELINSDGSKLYKNVNFKLKFNRIRKPYAANVSEYIGNTLSETVPRGSYAFLKLEFDVLNSKMEEGDIWELQGQVSTAYRGVFFYAEKSIFKVDVIDTPTTPAKQVPMKSTRLVPPIVAMDEAQEMPDTSYETPSSGAGSGEGVGAGARSGVGAGSGAGAGNETSNRGAGVGSLGSPIGGGIGEGNRTNLRPPIIRGGR
jgi:hypothetical protein